jgi:putative membrane protein
MSLESGTMMTMQAGETAAKGLNADTIIRVVVESVIFVGIGLVVFLVAFFLMTKLAPFSIRKEIEEDQNTSLGILMGSVIIGLAIIIAAAIGT